MNRRHPREPRGQGGTSESWARGLVAARTGMWSGLDHGPLSVGDGPWTVDYQLDAAAGRWLRERLPFRPWTLWRYRELLPIRSAEERVDLGEGGTPLVRLRRLVPPGISVWMKEESGNPTGSFKARGLSLAVNRARELGAPGVELPSAGNAALAAAAFAAAAGLACRIALPDDTPAGVERRCRLHGAEVLRGGATLVEAAERLAEDGRGFWDVSTFSEPYRVEGKKTMGFEIAEQLGWQLPDWIVYPTGGGTGIVGLAKAFDELRRLALVPPAPCRLVMVQMEGCAPLVHALAQGSATAAPWPEPRTGVWGLRVPRSRADFLVLRAVRDGGGAAVAVAETAVAAMQERAAVMEGLLVGPEGAAALSGLEQLIGSGRISPGDRVVVLQTGHPANYR